MIVCGAATQLYKIIKYWYSVIVGAVVAAGGYSLGGNRFGCVQKEAYFGVHNWVFLVGVHSFRKSFPFRSHWADPPLVKATC